MSQALGPFPGAIMLHKINLCSISLVTSPALHTQPRASSWSATLAVLPRSPITLGLAKGALESIAALVTGLCPGPPDWPVNPHSGPERWGKALPRGPGRGKGQQEVLMRERGAEPCQASHPGWGDTAYLLQLPQDWGGGSGASSPGGGPGRF